MRGKLTPAESAASLTPGRRRHHGRDVKEAALSRMPETAPTGESGPYGTRVRDTRSTTEPAGDSSVAEQSHPRRHGCRARRAAHGHDEEEAGKHHRAAPVVLARQ